MQPGEYRVSLQRGSSGTPLLTLANLDVNRSVILMPYLSGDVPKAWSEAGLPKLRFLCGEGPCTITGVWTGEGDAYEFHYSRGKDGELRAAEIVLRPDRAN
jgi:hypothetical protein